MSVAVGENDGDGVADDDARGDVDAAGVAGAVLLVARVGEVLGDAPGVSADDGDGDAEVGAAVDEGGATAPRTYTLSVAGTDAVTPQPPNDQNPASGGRLAPMSIPAPAIVPG